MNRLDPRTRFAALFLCIALLAALVVGVSRVQIERQTRRVELAMDYNDFLALSRGYNYNANSLLIQLRQSGLTSLALTEELGGSLTGSGTKDAFAISGIALLNAARISPIADPTLAEIVRSKRVREGEMYLLVYNTPAFRRYMQQLPLHFERSGIKVIRMGPPYVIALRTQSDFFGAVGLGIPADQIARARRFGFFIIPRFQNDERLSEGQIARMFDDLHVGKWASTAVFFGLRNQVLGYPDHIDDTANVFKSHRFMNFGEIETYDPSQAQKGADQLAKDIPGRTVRVQAITKAELDKLSVPEIVARYELGVRERNVRVVYLRPFLHEYNKMSIEQTNLEIVRQIATDLRQDGFTLGRASPVPLYRGNNRVLVGVSALAVPSMFVLLLGWYGWYGRRGPVWAAAAYALTVLLYVAGVVSHHDLLARSILALCAALLFATAAFTVLSGAFSETPAASMLVQLVRSLRWTLLATGVALLGALTVVGLMSSPLTMEEVEPFRGVKLVLAAPPLIALALYLFTSRFNSGIRRPGDALTAPIRIYQLLLAAAVLAIAALVLMRSGNTSDIAPSSFELALRHHLTTLLSVRPRFKEFVIGFPLMMLLPALYVHHRRAVGVLLALGIGIGIGDIIDTFSHLHTPLLVSLLRVFNGLVLGAVIGAIAILVYRAVTARLAAGETAPELGRAELLEV
ncbi:MAG TPA: DUF5693 family protein [Candidatus Baltobacteraceae bacterium]|nr:DUF5693 family protein [Candidatus Baltobacteraceae bacterium]